MWQALRDIVTSAKDALGIEVPDVGAVTDVVTGAGDQASDAATTATDTASDAADTATGAVSGAGEAVAGAGGQIASKLTGILDRFGG